MQGGGGGGLHCWDPHPYPGSAQSWCIDPTAHGGAGAAGRGTALTSPGRSLSHGRHRCPPGQCEARAGSQGSVTEVAFPRVPGGDPGVFGSLLKAAGTCDSLQDGQG